MIDFLSNQSLKMSNLELQELLWFLKNLYKKKEIFIRDLTIDFNADRNQNEKRFTIGEHNGEEWVRKPKSIILNQVRESRTEQTVRHLFCCTLKNI